MRIEQAYPGEALRHLRDEHAPPRLRAVIYFTTGDVVEPGAYHCTFCGCAHRLRRPTSLPLCPTCDGSEFTVGEIQASPADENWLEEMGIGA